MDTAQSPDASRTPRIIPLHASAAASEAGKALPCPHCGGPLSGRMRLATLSVAPCPHCLNPVLFTESGITPAPGFTDNEATLTRQSVIGRIYGAASEHLEKLPVLPGVFQQVLSLIHDPISSIDDLVAAVERDATLTLHLLKLANSVLYRGASAVEEARGACVRLGMREIANVVWRVQAASAFRTREPALAALMTELWNTSVAAGYGARTIAVAAGGPGREQAFLAGLTHAVGQTLLVEILAHDSDFAIGRLGHSEDRSRQVLDRHGPPMSLVVLAHWGVPAPLQMAALYQQRPSLAPEAEGRRFAHLVMAGAGLAARCGYPPAGKTLDDALVAESLEALKVSQACFDDLAEEHADPVAEFVSSMVLE